MPVRLTESRIPEGLSASDLGPADTKTITDPIGSEVKLSLVSYLPHLTRFDRELISENRYVVFIEGTSGPQYVQYKWKIEGYVKQKNNWVLSWEQVSQSDQSILSLDNVFVRDLVCFSLMSKIKVTVLVYGIDMSPIELKLQLEIHRDTKKRARDNVAKKKGSSSGAPTLTQRIANYYGPYFELIRNEPGFEDRDDHRKVQLVVARVYGAYLKNFEGQNRADYLWEKYLIDNVVSEELPWLPLGVAWIYPPIFAMFVSENVLGAASPALISPMLIRESFAGDEEAYIQQLFTDFNNLSSQVKLDVYNILRFPKSCTRACSLYLERLKNRHTSWQNIKWNDFLNESITDKDHIRHLLDEFWQGPTDQTLTRFEHDTRAIELIAKDYIYLASATNKCLLLRTEDMIVTLTTNEENPEKREALDELNSASSVDLYNQIPSQDLGIVLQDETAKWTYPIIPEIYYKMTRLVCTYVVQIENAPDPTITKAYSIVVYRHEWTGEEWQTHSLPVVPAEDEERIRRRARRNKIHVAYEAGRYIEEIEGAYRETTVPEEVAAGLEKVATRLQLALALERSAICLGHSSGIVNTSESDRKVTWVSGEKFNLGWMESGILFTTINGVNYGIKSIDSETELILADIAHPGDQNSVEYKVTPPFINISKAIIKFMSRYMQILNKVRNFPFSMEHLSNELTTIRETHSNVQFMNLFSTGVLPEDGGVLQSAGMGNIPQNEDYELYKTGDYHVIPMEFILDKPKSVTDSPAATLTEPSQIDDLIVYLRDWVNRALPKLKLLLIGYADKSFIGPGDRETYNLQLSQLRVDWINNRLPVDLKSSLAVDTSGQPFIETVACGDKYSELPEQNSDYREVRVLLYPEEEKI